ncbi:hypothetical protein [Tunturiibacter gelidiferens]|uniref:hypothetical protein n=1 Tax=Tunturiibacter gelidiferens TaxID=3069689 RepID=UPI003D9AC6DE
MLQPYRDRFNAQFTSSKYDDLLAHLNRRTRTSVDFRVAETPCFFPNSLMEELSQTGAHLTHQLLDNPAYLQASEQCVPRNTACPTRTPAQLHDRRLRPRSQLRRHPQSEARRTSGLPSIFGYQDILCRQYIETYNLEPAFSWHLGGLNEQTYWQLLSKVILNNHAPENVILLEIDPDHQKTLPDFHIYEDKLGIATVDITTLIKRGNRLFYHRNGREIPIHRIYNRAIVDELERKNIKLPFDYRDALDVEWAGHPNWYFRISKFSLPYLDHPAVPKAVFLDDWYARPSLSGLPEDRENSSSNLSTPSQGRESSSPPPTTISAPSHPPTVIFTSSSNASPSSPSSTPPRPYPGRDPHHVPLARRRRPPASHRPRPARTRSDDGRRPQSQPALGRRLRRAVPIGVTFLS